jgi:hypothetical protein
MLTFVVVQILVGALIAGFAVRFSGKRDIRAFLLALVGVWLVVSVLLSATDELTLRSAVATSLWCLSIAAIYAAIPGVLVAAGKSAAKIWISSFLVLVVQISLSFYSALYIGCYVGRSCP